RRSKLLFGEKRAKRNACRNRLGNRDDVGHHAKTLERENCPRPAQATLDLVEDQRGFVAIRQGTTLLEKFHGTLVNTAFPENRFQHNRASVVVDGGAEFLRVIAWNEFHILQQRFETFTIFVLSGQRHGAKGPSVIGAFERNQLALGVSAGTVPRQAGQ